MAWVRLDDNAMDHPKIVALSDGAFRLWVRGLTYCQRYLTDGLIPVSALRLFPGSSRARIEELTHSNAGGAALWEQVDGGVRVHDYVGWNESRATVQKKKQESKERLERFLARKKQRAVNALQTHSSIRVVNDVPTQPNHVLPKEQEVSNPPSVERVVKALGVKGHRGHVFCGVHFCVPDWLDEKFQKRLGPALAAKVDLKAWYVQRDEALPDDFVMEETAENFLQHQFTQALKEFAA